MYKLLNDIDFYSAKEVDENFSNESIIKERERAEEVETRIQSNLDVTAARLDSEITRATEAEAALDTRMTDYEANLTAETQRATEAENHIQSNVDTVAASLDNKTNALDEKLDEKIAAEQARAEAAEQQLQTNIEAEAARATAAEQTNSDAIAAEALRAQETEREINNALLSESLRAQEAEAALSASLTAEAQRATAAETQLQTNIDNEVTRATTAETQLQTNIDNEVTRATTAETQLQTNIDNEVIRATAAETQLQTNIDNEVIRATAAEETNKQAIEAEVTRATAAEETNKQAIEAEVTRATNKENELNQLIADEELRATTAEADLTNDILATNTKITNLTTEVRTNSSKQVFVYATAADMPNTTTVDDTKLRTINGQLAFVEDTQEWYKATVTDTAVTWNKYSMPMSADKLEDYPYVVNPKPGQYRWLRFDPDNKNGLVIQKGVVINLSYFGTNATLHVNQDMKFDMGSSLVNGTKYYVIMTYSTDAIQLTPKLRVDVQDDDIIVGFFSTLCVSVGDNVTMKVRTQKVAPVYVADTSKFLVKPYDENEDNDFYNFYYKLVKSIDDSMSTQYNILTVEHPLSGYVAGNILPESIFCTTFRPSAKYQKMYFDKSDFAVTVDDNMVYDKVTGKAVDIYLGSSSSERKKSSYNNGYAVQEYTLLLTMAYVDVGKELLSNEEFTSAALGSNEGTVVAGATLPTDGHCGGHVDTAGRRMISAIGCEEMCGMLWQLLRDLGPVGWLNISDYDGRIGTWTDKCDPSAAFGKTFGVPYMLHAGGSFGDGGVDNNSGYCGSFARMSIYTMASYDTNKRHGGRGTCRIIRGYE